MNYFSKIVVSIACFLAVSAVATAKKGSERIVIGGSGWNQIAIIDKQSREVIWTHDLEPGNECNGVAADRKGNILYSYKQGARLIDRSGKTIWDYPAAKPEEEVQFATVTDKGFVLAVCGNPSRIVELDRAGRVTKEIRFDTEIERPHSQFRQICPLGNGSYLVPLLSQSQVIIVNPQGEITDRIRVEGKPFSVKATTTGTYIVSGGDGHCITEVTPQGDVVRRIGQDDIPGISLGYVAQINPDEKGNWLICNWLGHGADPDQPHLIEIDPQNRVIWSFGDKERVGRVSTAYSFREK